MLGIILAVSGTFFDEAATSIGKKEVAQGRISIYTMGFLNNLLVILILTLVMILKRQFIFSLASLPTFCIRAVLEVILIQIALKAVCRSDRSTFGFIRVLTLPLLLIVDLTLGYKLSYAQIIGIILIMATLFFIFTSHGLKKQGSLYCLLTALLAVATISLYKYDISHYNSVEAEQTLIGLIIIIYLLGMAIFWAKEKPWRALARPILLTQSVSAGIGSVAVSYAYLFAPASIIIAVLRSSAVIWTVVSGKFYFKERKILVKIIYLVLLVVGIILLTR